MKPSELESLLQKKFGFSPAELKYRSVDHKWYELCLPELRPVYTKVSHNNKEIGFSLEGKIARQLRVRQKVFRLMADCHVDKEEYYEILRTNPYEYSN